MTREALNIGRSHTSVSIEGNDYTIPVVSALQKDAPQEPIVYLAGIGEGRYLEDIAGHISQETGRDVHGIDSRLPTILKRPWQQAGHVPREILNQAIQCKVHPEQSIHMMAASLGGLTMASYFDGKEVDRVTTATAYSPVMIATHKYACPELKEYAETVSLKRQLQKMKDIEGQKIRRNTARYFYNFVVKGGSAEARAAFPKDSLQTVGRGISTAREISRGITRAHIDFAVVANGITGHIYRRAVNYGVGLHFIIGADDAPHPSVYFWDALENQNLADRLVVIDEAGANTHTNMASPRGRRQLEHGIYQHRAA